MTIHFPRPLQLISSALVVFVLVLGIMKPPIASAHIGGKSGVKVDGLSVSSDAFSAYYAVTPSDISLKPLPVGQTASFEVDQSIIQGGSGDFRWYWENDRDYTEGITAKHAFSKAGMYIVNLKYRGSSSNTYDVIDTIGVAVVPKAGYRMPDVKMRVTQTEVSGQPYSYSIQAAVVTDPSTKIVDYTWQYDADSKADSKEQNVVRSFASLREVNNALTGLTVTDGNGLKTNATMHIVTNSSGAMDVAVVQDEYPRSAITATTTKSSSNILPIVAGIGAALVIIIAGVLLRKRSAKK